MALESIPSRTLSGYWAQNPFSVSHILIMGNRSRSASMTFGKIQTVANERREGMRRPRRSSQETITLFGRVLVPALAQPVQPFSHVRLSATPWTAACQASLSFTTTGSLLKLTSIESVMPSRDKHKNVFELSCRFRNPHKVGEVNHLLPTSM